MIRISVRNLIEFVLRSGDYRSEFTASSRPVEGTKGHRRVQKSRPESYRSEISISRVFSVNELEIEVQGRIDGIFEGPVIDEIKTTYAELPSEGHPMHWAQAKFYAWMVALNRNLDVIDVQLTYLQLDSQQTREIRNTFPRKELEDCCRKILDSYAEWAKLRTGWEIEKLQSAEKLEFPFDEYREGQRQLAVGVWRTIDTGKRLYVQAPTGIGKTMGTIFPTVKACERYVKLFYLTAKTTGRAVAENTFGILRGGGLKFKSLTLTAKEKICFSPGSACVPEECLFAEGYFDRLREALEDAHRYDNLDRATIEEVARRHRVCPFEFSLEVSLWADAVICDYNYVFDPRVYLRRFFLESSDPYLFLIDEAHNLPDRARDMYSAALSKKDVLKLRRLAKGTDIAETLKTLNNLLLESRKSLEADESEFSTVSEPPEDILKLLKLCIAQMEKWLVVHRGSEIRQDVLDFYFASLAFVRTSELFDERYLALYEKRRDELTVMLYCLDPSFLLGKALEKSVSSVIFSATLSPIEYYMDILAAAPEDSYLQLDSPFPRKNVAVLVANRIPTTWKLRDQSAENVAEMIRAAVACRKGNYIAYFPSYRYMQTVLELIELPDAELIVQESGLSEGARDEFLARFSSDNDVTRIGFCVMGGVFGEGIDLVGDRLVGAIIVGVGLPQINTRLDLIRDYYNDKDGSGFQYAYMYPGMGRVLQAAGRVIRTETDKGVIFLIDERFTHRRYLDLFPSLWKNYRPVRDAKDVQNLLKRFW